MRAPGTQGHQSYNELLISLHPSHGFLSQEAEPQVPIRPEAPRAGSASLVPRACAAPAQSPEQKEAVPVSCLPAHPLGWQPCANPPQGTWAGCGQGRPWEEGSGWGTAAGLLLRGPADVQMARHQTHSPYISDSIWAAGRAPHPWVCWSWGLPRAANYHPAGP